MTDLLNALRDALTAARPSMTPEQQTAADALLTALARMAEPAKYPAWVMAQCSTDRDPTLHVLRLNARWECRDRCLSMAWDSLRDPRPLTAEERAEYGIPGECTRPHAEPITDELVEQCIKATGNFMYPSWARGVLRAAGHPEATR